MSFLYKFFLCIHVYFTIIGRQQTIRKYTLPFWTLGANGLNNSSVNNGDFHIASIGTRVD